MPTDTKAIIPQVLDQFSPPHNHCRSMLGKHDIRTPAKKERALKIWQEEIWWERPLKIWWEQIWHNPVMSKEHALHEYDLLYITMVPK